MKIHKILPLLLVFGVSNGLEIPSQNESQNDAANAVASTPSCSPLKWADEETNACMCCVVKHSPQHKHRVQFGVAVKIVKECKGDCPTSARKKISDKFNVNASLPHEFVNAILAHHKIPQ